MSRIARSVDWTAPGEFDADCYRSTYPDLATMDPHQLSAHFESFGRREGRIASAMAARNEFVRFCSSFASVLEIGPFDRPAIVGTKVSYFDVLDTEGLRQRAKALGREPAAVPQVEYFNHNGDLSVVDRTFEAVFSSHCIEHQPDLILHLQQVEKLLDEGGAYFLLIPDKLYCFDHFIAESTVAGIIDAHESAHRNHRLASVIEHRALTTHNDPLRHWRGDHSDPGYTDCDPARIRAGLEKYRSAQGGYIDVHAWQFTPESFRRICQTLHELGYTKLRPARVYDTPFGSNEFTAILAP